MQNYFCIRSQRFPKVCDSARFEVPRRFCPQWSWFVLVISLQVIDTPSICSIFSTYAGILGNTNCGNCLDPDVSSKITWGDSAWRPAMISGLPKCSDIYFYNVLEMAASTDQDRCSTCALIMYLIRTIFILQLWLREVGSLPDVNWPFQSKLSATKIEMLHSTFKSYHTVPNDIVPQQPKSGRIIDRTRYKIL